MNLFLICENCNWEIIPMLLGAWVLGFLFWWLFFRSRNKSKMENVSAEMEQAKIQLNKLQRDLEAERYKNVKLTDEISTREKLIKSLEYKIEQKDD